LPTAWAKIASPPASMGACGTPASAAWPAPLCCSGVAHAFRAPCSVCGPAPSERERELARVVRTQHVPPTTVWARPLLATLLEHAWRCCSASRSGGSALVAASFLLRTRVYETGWGCSSSRHRGQIRERAKKSWQAALFRLFPAFLTKSPWPGQLIYRCLYTFLKCPFQFRGFRSRGGADLCNSFG
jgi:hypothetical protein